MNTTVATIATIYRIVYHTLLRYDQLPFVVALIAIEALILFGHYEYARRNR